MRTLKSVFILATAMLATATAGRAEPLKIRHSYVVPVANWTPLLTTPSYPTYAGNVACLSAASARALQIAFDRDDIPFTVIYPRTMGLPTETRTYAGFWDLAQQQADSRIFGGIHYRFDNDLGAVSGKKVGELVVSRLIMKKQTK